MQDGRKIISTNRRAFHDYEILDRWEAGLVLRGSEVKSLREGNVKLADAFARVERGELILRNFHIPQYKGASWANHDPDRPKKLLVHKRELRRLVGATQEKGLTLIPLSLYFRRGFAKVELGLARGKRLYDKREAIKKREAEREMRRGRDSSV